MSGPAMELGIGVTRCTQYEDRCGVSTGTEISRRRRPRALRVPEHHLAVGEDVGAADLDDPTGACRGVEAGRKVLEHVADRDGLHARVDPARADHHRQTFGEIADHLERQAAGADDHGGAHLGHRDAAAAQRRACLLARAQVLGEVALRVAEAAEVDDAADAGSGRRRAELPRQPDVPLPIALRSLEAVDEVVRDVDPGQRLVESSPALHVAFDDLDLRGPGTPGEPVRAADQAAHAATAGGEERRKPAADVAGDPGDEDQAAGRPRRWCVRRHAAASPVAGDAVIVRTKPGDGHPRHAERTVTARWMYPVEAQPAPRTRGTRLRRAAGSRAEDR